MRTTRTSVFLLCILCTVACPIDSASQNQGRPGYDVAGEMAAVAPGEPPVSRPSPAVQQFFDQMSELQRTAIRSRRAQPGSSPTERRRTWGKDWIEQELQLAELALLAARNIGDAAGEAEAQEARSLDLEALERIEDAAAASLEAAAAWERAGESSEQVFNLIVASGLLHQTDATRCNSLLGQVLELARAETRRPKTVAGYLQSGGLHRRDLAEARLLLQAALAMRERLMPDSPETADTLFFLADNMMEGGDIGIAEPLLLRALSIRERQAPESEEMVAAPTTSILNSLGIVQIYKDDMQRAREYLLRCLAIEQKLRPGSPGGVSLVNLAVVAAAEGDYMMADQYYRQIWEDAEKRYPNWVPGPGLLSNRGSIALALGDLGSAKDYFQRALESHAKRYTKPEGPPSVAGVHRGLGMVAYRQGDLQLAMECFERALAVAEKEFRPNAAFLAGTLLELGDVYRARGDLDRAEACLRRAQEILEKSPFPAKRTIAALYRSLGEVARTRGRRVEAREHLRHALAVEEEIAGTNHPHLEETLLALATVEAESRAAARAFPLALRAEQMGWAHLQLTARSLPERQALLYASTRVSGLDLVLSLVSGPLRESTGARREAFDAVVRSRALVLDEMGTRHRSIRGTPDPEVARLSQDFDAKRARLAKLVVRGPEPALTEPFGGLAQVAADRYPIRLEQYRREAEEAERLLALRSVAFRQEQARKRIGLEQVAAALSPRNALIAFARYNHLDAHGSEPAFKSAEPVPSYVAFVLPGPTRELAVVPLGPADQIDALISRWREQMTEEAVGQGRSLKRMEAESRRAGEALRRKVWDPLARYVRGAKRVLIVPDGPLSLVNLAALPAGTGSYLIETGPLIHYLSAERDLVPAETRPRAEGLLAVGAPAFDEKELFAVLASQGKAKEQAAAGAPATFRGSRSACGEFQSLRFEPVPAAAQEAESILALWTRRGGRAQPRLRGASSSESKDTLLLSGSQASEAAFKQHSPGKRILHLATHGFFLNGPCPSALEALPKSPSTQRGASATGDNPLLLSGLAMAGANNRQSASPEEEDGVLTAEEIAALDLEGVEWAVLSACDTGLGEIRAGEGVFGLRRAFQVAGVRTLVMSLWPAEDNATQEWMNSLYRRRFLNGAGTAEAVRDTSLELLRNRRARNQSTHPFYWAAFVAVGDWR